MSNIAEFFDRVNQLSHMSVYLVEAKPSEKHGVFNCEVDLGPHTVSNYSEQPEAVELDEYQDIPPAEPMEQLTYQTLRTSVEVNQYVLGDIIYAHMIADGLSELWDDHVRGIAKAK